MDKKTINNKAVKEVVKFECFFFSPNFDQGNYAGTFTLLAWSWERESHFVTSDIIDIHETDDIVYIETLNSVYQLDSSKTIYHLEEVKRYLNDEEYTSSEFYRECVPNELPTPRGWRIF